MSSYGEIFTDTSGGMFKAWPAPGQDVSDEAQIRDIVALVRVLLVSIAVGIPLALVMLWR